MPAVTCLMQAKFWPPTSLPPTTQPFLSLTDAQKLVDDLNTILSETGFNPQPSNPWFFIAMFSGIATMAITLSITLSNLGSGNVGLGMGFMMFGIFLPYILFFVAVHYYKKQRRERLTQYVEDWNRWDVDKNKTQELWSFVRAGGGVKLSFGGGGTTPRVSLSA